MNFSTDRDLLAWEPGIFNDCPFAAQQRVDVIDGVLDGTTLMSVEADFEAAGAEPGSVVLVGREPFEVMARVDANTLEISRPRARLTDAAIPGGSGEGMSVKLRSFEPQAALVRDQLLRLLGIEVDDPDATLNEDAVVSLSVMARLEALGTLERVYSGAVAVTGDNELLLAKAQAYGKRFRDACTSATVLVDTDNDGHANERRRLGLRRLVRV